MHPFTRRIAAAVLVLVTFSPVAVAGAAAPVSRAVARPATQDTPVDRDAVDDGLRTESRPVELTDAARGLALTNEPEMVIVDHVDPDTELSLRSRNDGVWSEWMTLEADGDDAPDGADGGEGSGTDGSSGVGPIWIGHGADRIELVRTAGGDDEVTLETLELVEPRGPSSADESRPRGIRSSAAAGGPSYIRSRSSWATSDMGWATLNSGCGLGPSHNAKIKAMVVHHTAGSNSYSPGDVPGIIRGIWYYHVQSRGWCDIAYNFLVDRYGGIWEGRQGGVTEPIIGGHTYGYNTDTSGVAQLGNFDSTGSPAAMTTSTERLVGWKLAIHGVDPSGWPTLTNRAPNATARGVPSGGTVRVPAVSGHRDLGSTSCPGGSTYAQMGRIRAGARDGAKLVALHRAFLGTTPNDGPYGYWADVAGRSGLNAAALAMARSDEYVGPIVDDLYQRVHNRRPDPSGRQYWIGQLRSGVTVETVSIYFYGSPEHYQRAGSPELYVRSLYKDLLHREPDPSGLAYWSGQLRSGRSGPPDVVWGFFRSLESRRDRVNRLYRSILSRSADSGGLDYWADQLQRHDDLVLATFLALSDEYYQRNFS